MDKLTSKILDLWDTSPWWRRALLFLPLLLILIVGVLVAMVRTAATHAPTATEPVRRAEDDRRAAEGKAMADEREAKAKAEREKTKMTQEIDRAEMPEEMRKLLDKELER